MKNRKGKIILGFIFISFAIVTLYIFNSEKLYSEYWLQKRIGNYSGIEPLENIEYGNETLKYKFYENSEIDIEIALNSNGIVNLSTHSWIKNSKEQKTYLFRTDKSAITKLINEFKLTYAKSDLKSVEDHLSGHYSTLTLNESNSGKEIEIGFYNLIPDRKFKEFKEKIIKVGNKVITELEE